MKVFFDLDETLIHSRTYKPRTQESFFSFSINKEKFWTSIRPSAKEVIDFARQQVGHENVYILTVASYDYAHRICNSQNWGFLPDYIIARETIKRYTIEVPMMYTMERVVSRHPLAHESNILIDNLPPKHNDDKTNLMGINPVTHYLQIEEYLGYNIEHQENTFKEQVKNFIINKKNQ